MDQIFMMTAISKLRLLMIVFSILASGCGLSDPTAYALGTLERDRIELVADQSEPIVKVFVQEGATLQAGQPILQLDARRMQARLDQAQAALDQAQARLAELRRGPRAEAIAEAQARLEGAKSRETEAAASYQRQQALVQQKLASQATLDQALMSRDSALAEVAAATEAVRALRTGTTAEELTQAESAVRRAEALVAELAVSLERLTVTTPRPAYLDSLPYKLGTQPPPNAVVAILLADGAPYARVYIPESHRVHIHTGMELKVLVDGIADPFAGVVNKVNNEAAFTPYFALTERDRTRLSFVAEVTLVEEKARQLPTGIPAQVVLPDKE